MVRVAFIATWSPFCKNFTTMVQNSARVRLALGLKRLPPTPSTTPISRSTSALTAVFRSDTSEKDEPPAAPAGMDRERASAAARAKESTRFSFINNVTPFALC